jgi:hypothetical protein
MRHEDIEYKTEYSGKYVAIDPVTGEVLAFANEIYTSVDYGDGLIEITDKLDVPYVLHYFDPNTNKQLHQRVLRK